MIIELFLLLISLAIVAVVSDKVIVYVSKLAFYFRISEMSAGFILLSVSTSLPELFIALISSLTTKNGISLGNVLGANIANLTIVMSFSILLSKVKLYIKTFQKELSSFLFLTSLIPIFLLQKGVIEPIFGAVLLIFFIYFGVNLSKKTEKIKPLGYVRSSEIKLTSIKFLVSIAILLIFSKIIVDNGVNIAKSLSLPASVIGATIISIGTTLPELITSVQALRKHLYGMVLGNILGSCITNLTLILGLNALLSTTQINITAISGMIFFMLFSTLIVWHLINTKEYFGKKTAILLILIYIAFILQQVGFSIFNLF
ncbi:MAG: hypothetical protein QXD43_02895 [Candidatus Aenigmatarchaeota archaeon]